MKKFQFLLIFGTFLFLIALLNPELNLLVFAFAAAIKAQKDDKFNFEDEKAIVTNADIPERIPTDGLVAYYPFEKDARDASGHGHDGSMKGNAIIVTGKIGNGLGLLRSNSHILIPHHPVFNFQGSGYTIAFWFNQSDFRHDDICFNSDRFSGLIFSKKDVFDFRRNLTGELSFGFTHKGIIESTIPAGLTGEWHHFAVVGQKAQYTNLYIDGQKDNSASYIFPNEENNTYPIWIGVKCSMHMQRTKGILDEVYFYTRGLSRGEIKLLYNQQLMIKDRNKSGTNFNSLYYVLGGVCGSATLLILCYCGNRFAYHYVKFRGYQRVNTQEQATEIEMQPLNSSSSKTLSKFWEDSSVNRRAWGRGSVQNSVINSNSGSPRDYKRCHMEEPPKVLNLS